MDYIKLTGKISDNGNGCEASLIIPIGDYKIMILSNDNCGAGKGEILRSELFVYHRDKVPLNNINEKIFGQYMVTADSETLNDAFQYCQRQLKIR